MGTKAPLLLLVVCLLSFTPGPLNGQSMVDLSKEEVRVLMKEKHRGFRRDNMVVNQQFNYLKYVNGLKTRTWILYFTDEDICRSTKMICDYGEYDEVLDEMDAAYEKVGEMEWAYQLKSDTIYVTLTRQEWYFTIREARKQQ